MTARSTSAAARASTPRDVLTVTPGIRFIHSADWQLGMTRHFLSPDAQARFSQARIDVITSIGPARRLGVVAPGDARCASHPPTVRGAFCGAGAGVAVALRADIRRVTRWTLCGCAPAALRPMRSGCIAPPR